MFGMSESTCSFWHNLSAKVESVLLWIIFKHDDGRPKCTAYEALFFYHILVLHQEMILAQNLHSTDDEHDETFTKLIGTTANYMLSACHTILHQAAEYLSKVAREKGLKGMSSQKIVKVLKSYVRSEDGVNYKCYKCGNVGVALWDAKKKYKICSDRDCAHWYLMPVERNVDYKETVTVAYIMGFLEWLEIEAEKAKSIIDFWKLRMKSMKLLNEDDGDVRRFSNYIVNSEDSKGSCVCSEGFKAGSEVKILPCGHLMHSACLSNLLMHSDVHARNVKKGPRCPVCRNPLLKVRGPGSSRRKKRHRHA